MVRPTPYEYIMFPNQQPFYAAPAATIRSLNAVVTKESMDAWFNQTRAFTRAIHSYARYMDLTWKSHDVTQGFQDTVVAGVNVTAQTQSAQVESILCAHMLLDQQLNQRALRAHRLTNDAKCTTLLRREGKRLNAF